MFYLLSCVLVTQVICIILQKMLKYMQSVMPFLFKIIYTILGLSFICKTEIAKVATFIICK